MVYGACVGADTMPASLQSSLAMYGFVYMCLYVCMAAVVDAQPEPECIELQPAK